jgi:cell division protein FtsW
MIMMFVGRINLKAIGFLVVVGIGLFILLLVIGKAFPALVRVDTWISRWNDFMYNNEGAYQVQQAKIAIAKGGKLWGLGPGNSEQRNYLPHPYSDFIYAIVIEEYGLLGGFVMIFLYLLLLFRIVRMVTLAPKAFGAIAAVGLGVLITIQALANMAVSVHMVPVTGQTLPLVSMGGNSVLFTCVALGIIQSIGKYVEAAKDEAD